MKGGWHVRNLSSKVILILIFVFLAFCTQTAFADFGYNELPAIPPWYLLLIFILLVISAFQYKEETKRTIKYLAYAVGFSVFFYFGLSGLRINMGLMFYYYVILFDILIFLQLNIKLLLMSKNSKRRIISGILLFFCALTVIIILSTADNVYAVTNGFTSCQHFLKEIGAAQDLYYRDHGSYSDRLEDLKPEYLERITYCFQCDKELSPKAINHYWRYYHIDIKSYEYHVSDDKQNYTIVCRAPNHLNVGVDAGYPQFSSVDGLTPRRQ
jgi:hypothetical protein